MKFGVFDHMDDAGVPLGELFAGRLRLAEAYDRAGFHAYHLAEHHGTPIGCAASPGLFLAALAQRTTKLRFGPMVYLLPFYHPLRLIEEVCMLDQMSGGRLELGVGRGVSPFETANYALDFAQTQAMYHEAFQVLLKGLRRGRADLRRQILSLRQGADDPAAGAAPASAAVVRRQPSPTMPIGRRRTTSTSSRWRRRRRCGRSSSATSRCESKLGKDDSTLYGVGRHVVVADTDEAALAIARRAYPRWRTNFFWLFERHGSAPRVAGALSEDLRRTGGARHRRRRLAADRARFHRRRHQGHRSQLLDALARLRRHDARGSAALGRPVRPRGDAGVQVTELCHRSRRASEDRPAASFPSSDRLPPNSYYR